MQFFCGRSAEDWATLSCMTKWCQSWNIMVFPGLDLRGSDFGGPTEKIKQSAGRGDHKQRRGTFPMSLPQLSSAPPPPSLFTCPFLLGKSDKSVNRSDNLVNGSKKALWRSGGTSVRMRGRARKDVALMGKWERSYRACYMQI